MSSFQLRRTVAVYRNLLASATVPTLLSTATRATTLSARSCQNSGPWYTPVNPTCRQDRFYASTQSLDGNQGKHETHPRLCELARLDDEDGLGRESPWAMEPKSKWGSLPQQFSESLRRTVKWIQNNSKALKPPPHSVADLAQSAVRPFEDARDLCLTTQNSLGRIHDQIMDMQHNISVFNIELERADRFVTSNEAYTDALNDAKYAQNAINILNQYVQPYFESRELKSLGDEVGLLLDRTITQKDVLERILTDHMRGTATVANTWFRPVFHHRFAEKILDILALAPPSEVMLPYMRSILALLSRPGNSVLTPDSDSLARWRRRPQPNLKTRLEEIVNLADDY
ncbi:hypothetical protein EAF00_002306 [Botryotinia globosa]|nr:hypothetical protein EAF00_002306 [Botryotinia globosa]